MHGLNREQQENHRNEKYTESRMTKEDSVRLGLDINGVVRDSVNAWC